MLWCRRPACRAGGWLLLVSAALVAAGLYVAQHRQQPNATIPGGFAHTTEETMGRYIIRTIRTAHCKLGPERCEKCREMDVARICLLDIDPPDAGMAQRRVIRIERDGEELWREFDVVRAFADRTEALEYAEANSISDVEL